MIVQDTVAIKDAQPGMRLAMAVMDVSGRVLLPAGAVLTDGTLQSLQRRNVLQLVIEREVMLDPAVLAGRQAEIEEQLARLFRKAGEGDATRALHNAILAFQLERCA